MQNTAVKIVILAIVLFWTVQPSCFRGVAAETSGISVLESMETHDSGESVSLVWADFWSIRLADFLSPLSRPVQEGISFTAKVCLGAALTLRGPPAI